MLREPLGYDPGWLGPFDSSTGTVSMRSQGEAPELRANANCCEMAKVRIRFYMLVVVISSILECLDHGDLRRTRLRGPFLTSRSSWLLVAISSPFKYKAVQVCILCIFERVRFSPIVNCSTVGLVMWLRFVKFSSRLLRQSHRFRTSQAQYVGLWIAMGFG